MSKRYYIEEMENRVIIRGTDLSIVIEGDEMTIDTTKAINLKGKAFKKLDELPTPVLNSVFEALREVNK